jgi:hypothetical protein
MSTKNLARTVIEGGRDRYSSWARRHSNAVDRTKEREVSTRLLRSTDLDGEVYSRRPSVFRGFHDKLSPAARWMESQVGRPWDKVRGELFARFDTRTTAGRHILFDHVLPSVEGGPRGFLPRVAFRVDRHGILRRAPRSTWKRWKPRSLPREAEILAWLASRRVAERGRRLYWFLPTESERYRQDRVLDLEEAERWRSLPRWFQEQHDGLQPRVKEM